MKDAPGAQKVGLMPHESVERWVFVFNTLLGVHGIEKMEALT